MNNDRTKKLQVDDLGSVIGVRELDLIERYKIIEMTASDDDGT
jgi:hypothetical protein